MIKVKEIVWDEWNVDHIKKHNISITEVEEVCRGHYKQQPSYKNRFLIFGKTLKRRLLTVVLARESKGKYYIITARDMSKKERKVFIK